MNPDHSRRSLLRKTIRHFPTDLAAVICLTILTIFVVFLPIIRETQIRIIFGLPFVLFLPGYAFISALFPKKGSLSDISKEEVNENNEVDIIERSALSVGMSLALVPLLGLGLNFTPWGIRFMPIIVCLSGFTIGCTVIAVLRRWKLPVEKRFSVSYRRWIAMEWSEVFKSSNRTDITLNILLALSVLLALGSIGFSVADPQASEQFTEFYILNENDDGELVVDNYPEELVQGEPESLIVGIENQEQKTVEYTVVVQLKRVEDNTAEAKVIERDELDRFDITLDHEETWHAEHELTPTMTGENLRLSYLLYKGESPEEPTKENSYRDLHLWITVEDTDAQEPIEITDKEMNTNA